MRDLHETEGWVRRESWRLRMRSATISWMSFRNELGRDLMSADAESRVGLCERPRGWAAWEFPLAEEQH